MALFNLGKKSKTDKKEEPKSVKQPVTKKAPKKEPDVEVKKEVATVAPAKSKKDIRIAPLVLHHAHITEKATTLVPQNQYVFRVFDRANKSEVKKAVKEVYGVDVVAVKIINTPDKQRRLGRTSGWRSGYKKAIVKIKAGQTIDLLPR